MQLLPVNLTALAAVILGTSIVLIPVAGLTLKFALQPVVSAFGRFLEARAGEESVQIMDRRMALLEQQLDSVQHSVDRLVEVAEFDANLKGGGAAKRLDAGPDLPG